MLDRRFEAGAVAVRLDGACAVDPGVGLGVDVGGDGLLGDAPVVEDLGHVHDEAGALGEPEHEVVVLRAFEPLAEAAHLGDERPPEHAEVVGVHLGAEAIR